MTRHADLLDLLDREMREPGLRHLIGKAYRPNFWSIIEYGRGSYETRYSRMLRWLMDPGENHGLGPMFARRLASLAAERSGEAALQGRLAALAAEGNPYEPDPSDGAEVEALISRGEGGNGGIDVLYTERRLGLCVAVENKMFAGEGRRPDRRSQLETYYDAVNRSKRHAHRVFVYLTPEGRSPEDIAERGGADAPYRRAWTALSYDDLALVLDEVFARLGADADVDAEDAVRNEHARKIVEDFLLDVRKTAQLAAASATYAPFAEYGDEIADFRVALGLAERDEGGERDEDAAAAEGPGEEQDPDEPEELQVAFRRRFGRAAADARRALQLVHEGVRVGRKDFSPSAETQRIVREFAEHLVGRSGIEAGTPLAAARFTEGFARVRLGTGRGQSVRIALHDGREIYLAGNGAGMVPAVVVHVDSRGCTLGSAPANRRLQAAHGGSGAALAEAFIAELRERAERGEPCGCGAVFTAPRA